METALTDNQIKNSMPILDFLKIFFAVCVIGIHSKLFVEYPTLYYWLNKLVFRVAVPFFLCASGFLIGVKTNGLTQDEQRAYYKRYSKRLLKLLLVFEPISIVLYSIQYYLSGISLTMILLRIVRSVLFCPWGALWYIQTVLVGMWLVFAFLRFARIELGVIIGGLLYAIALVCNSYYWLIEGTVVQSFADLILKVCDTARNGLFYGFFFICLGLICSKKRNRHAVCLFLLTFVLYIIELGFLQNRTMADDGSLFILSPFLAYFLVQLSSKSFSCSFSTLLIRNLSTGIYLIHRPIISIVSIVGLLTGNVIFSLVLFIIVLSVSICICLFAYKYTRILSSVLK